MNKIVLDNRTIGCNEPVLIIAEIGVNHGGCLENALNLIDAAREACVDAVKLQSHLADEEVILENSSQSNKYLEAYKRWKRFELSEYQHRIIKEYAEEKGLIFFSTAFSMAAVEMLNNIRVPLFKLGSGDITDHQLIELIASKGKPIIISTGMSTEKEIEDTVNLIRKYNVPYAIMHCTSLYPCPYECIDLLVIKELRAKYNVPVGLSDHTPTIYTAVASTVLGVNIIEKHFTLSKRLYGPDHKVSLTPEEMKELVQGVRAVEKALKTFNKANSTEIQEVREMYLKGIVARNDLTKGSTIRQEDLICKRGAKGIPANRIGDIVGKHVKRAISKNSSIFPEDIIGLE
ncbi:MAG TPA: N-acetylneuraminate synthase family protein [Thermodesulfobacteriota bacterium]|nr:N-acetylneuraminate synthase family protein [Thermodesulfobacteriota bacterium]